MTKTLSPKHDHLYFLSGGGEMGELTRNFDWSKTELGSPDEWPASLRTTLGIVLHSSFPMFLFWGPKLTCFYNDAFRPSLGIEGKHPALGKKGEEVWAEIWDFVGPMINNVMKTGEPVWFEDQLVPFYRNGKMEDIYWTFSYSPAYGDDGKINGVFVTCNETTKNIQTVKRLTESEKRFQALIREASVGIIVLIGDDFTVEIVNDEYGKLIGRRREELLNQPLFRIIPEAELHFRPIINNVRITGTPISLYDYPFHVFINGKRKDGFLNLVYQPYREENGVITGVVVQCHDVTEQVYARKNAEEIGQRLRSLVDSAPFPIGVYVGKEMRIEMLNQSIIDVWGKGGDLIGKTYSEVLPELADQNIYQQLDKVYTTGIPFHARNQRVDLVVEGKLQPFYFNYSFTPLFDFSGKVYGVMNTAADVTDLNIAKQKIERSEKNFRNMILQAPAAMCLLLGENHVVSIANDLILKLWGRTGEEIANKPVLEALPEVRSQGIQELLDTVYRTGETFTANERPVSLLRNGKEEVLYLNFVYEPYRDSDGSVLGILAISTDVTAQVNARLKIEEVVAERTKALASANDKLQKSNAELAQFAHIASHDLQEPLRKISTFTQMLENRIGNNIDEQSKNYLSKINSSAIRMHSLIRDVLTYSELAKEREEFVMVDLNEVIKNTITDYELLIEQKNAKIELCELPSIEAIPLQMSQLFGNLFANSLKYSKQGVRPVITITTGELPDADKEKYHLDPQLRYFKIEFKDNGIGFKPEYADQIFNIFQRLHRKSQYEGTGIGLAMCKKIALNHKGNMNAEGSSENGAVFNVFLPYKR